MREEWVCAPRVCINAWTLLYYKYHIIIYSRLVARFASVPEPECGVERHTNAHWRCLVEEETQSQKQPRAEQHADTVVFCEWQNVWHTFFEICSAVLALAYEISILCPMWIECMLDWMCVCVRPWAFEGSLKIGYENEKKDVIIRCTNGMLNVWIMPYVWGETIRAEVGVKGSNWKHRDGLGERNRSVATCFHPWMGHKKVHTKSSIAVQHAAFMT